MKILVTRPAEDGAEIAQRLADMGHEAILAPLLRVEFQAGPSVALDDVQAVLATSANGVRALAARSQTRDVPLFAVGPQTAAAAAKAGFLRIRNAEGDVHALAARTGEWADPGKGPLLQVAGEEAPGGLADALSAMGFQVRRENLYRVIAATELPASAAQALARDQVGAALFFSPRSAAVFAECTTRAGLSVQRLVGICISPNAAKPLEGLGFSEIRIAHAPNQAALLACL